MDITVEQFISWFCNQQGFKEAKIELKKWWNCGCYDASANIVLLNFLDINSMQLHKYLLEMQEELQKVETLEYE